MGAALGGQTCRGDGRSGPRCKELETTALHSGSGSEDSSATSPRSYASSSSGEICCWQPDRQKDFHLVPPKGWNGFIKAMGISARNNFPWDGKRPVPMAPPGCEPWLLPVSDEMSMRIAKLAESLREAGWKILTSKPHVILRLGNKAKLRDYAVDVGLLTYLPRHYGSLDDVEYPCVLKPATGEYGKEAHIADCDEDVLEVTSDGFGSSWVLQELITGCYEYAVSLLVQNGSILDAVGTRYEYSKERYVWPAVEEVGRDLFTVPDAHLSTMVRFLAEYSGICNFNYKLREDGRLCIFEINTRVGSDLACDVPRRRARDFFNRLLELRP